MRECLTCVVIEILVSTPAAFAHPPEESLDRVKAATTCIKQAWFRAYNPARGFMYWAEGDRGWVATSAQVLMLMPESP